MAVAALVATACSSTGGSRVGSSTASTARVTALASAPAASTAPQQTSCTPPSTHCLALVTLRGSDNVVVRDITDIRHPKTISTLGAIPSLQFVSASDLSYTDDSGIVRAPLAGSPKTRVVTSGQGGVAFAWSPDGSTVVYLIPGQPRIDVHQLTAGQDRTLGSTPAGGVGGCETIASCEIANTLDFRLSYSPDGTKISLVFSMFGASAFRVWSSDGQLLGSSDSQQTTMSVWSGTSLYFRDAKGVEVWRDGAVSSFLPGVAWIKPKASPAGGQIVYAARDSGGWAHTYVVDTTTRKVRELNAARTAPVFLTPRYVWYEGERPCAAADLCGSTPPWHPLSGKTYIYDLQDGTETEAIITAVFDLWPHPA